MTDDLGPDANPDDMLDGNVSAGMLASVFGVEMTATPGRCAHCGDMHAIGELRAYVQCARDHPSMPDLRWDRHPGRPDPDGHVRRCARGGLPALRAALTADLPRTARAIL